MSRPRDSSKTKRKNHKVYLLQVQSNQTVISLFAIRKFNTLKTYSEYQVNNEIGKDKGIRPDLPVSRMR